MNYVFLHGGGQGSWVWSETIAALERQTEGGRPRVLALDIPGCGIKRGQETGGLDVPGIARALVEEIEAKGFGDSLLVGHSQAGTILPLLIAARPALFRAALYVTCVAPLPDQTALDWRSSLPEGEAPLFTMADAAPRDRFRAMFCNDMGAAEAEAFLDKLGPDRWPDCTYASAGWHYDRVDTVPGTYVLCMRDTALLPQWQVVFAERLKARRIVHVDAGHQVMNTRPHALAEIIRLEGASAG